MYLLCNALAHPLMLENTTRCHSCNSKVGNQISQRQIPVTYNPSIQLTPSPLQFDSTSPTVLIYVCEETKHWFQTHTNHKHDAKNVTLFITTYRRTRTNQVFQ